MVNRSSSHVVVAAVALFACSDDPGMTNTDFTNWPVAGTGVANPGGAGVGSAVPGGAGTGAAPIAGAGSGNPGVAGNGLPGGMAGSGAPSAGAGDPGSAGSGMLPEPGVMPGDDAYAQYHDPGTGPWEMGSADECKMDTSLITGSDNLAVFRYGKLCHIQGGNTSGANWSATKTLGGVLAGRAAYLVKDVARSGPGTGPILHEDKATDWLGSVSFNNEALLSHVMSMTAFNGNLAYGSKSFSYDTLGTREISAIVDVAMVAVEQLAGMVPTTGSAFMSEQVFDKLGMTDSSWPGGTIGYGWSGTLEDMGRVGVMLVHEGWYGGERFMEASWVYRMSHPSHEDANTAYGQLAWLNSRGGGSSFGYQLDECAPPAFWPAYPHVGSESTDCGSTDGSSCDTGRDVGVYSAQGLGGQFVVMHPGLDMVIVAHNSGNPPALWAAVRPAVVAKDPMFMGDATGFCDAYGSGAYAPDLLVPRVAPTQ